MKTKIKEDNYVVLVIDKAESRLFNRYADKHRIFTKDEDAIAFAKTRGLGSSGYFFDYSLTPGVALIESGGDTDIFVIKLKVDAMEVKP